MRLGGRISAAIDVLTDIDTRHRPVADALKDWGLSHRFAGSGDRAAIGNLVYDVLRRKRSLGWRIGDDTPPALVYAALLDGYGQTGASLGAALAGDRFAPEPLAPDMAETFAARALAGAPPAVQADIPDWLSRELEAQFGEAWIAEAQALAERPPLDLRANRLKADRDKVLKALDGEGALPSRLAPDGVRIAPIAGDGRHPNVQVEAAFQKGWFEIQDEGSQLAALLSGAASGEQVLDLCAGAGGKTLALAAQMDNHGQVHAYDSDKQRLAPIYERLNRAGARNVQVHPPRADLADLQGRMDLVLVDAPCTGTGTWRRRPDAKWRLSDAALSRRTDEQDRVLDQATSFVRPGGRLVYVTCSMLRSENAARVEALLARNPEISVLDAAAAWGERVGSDAGADALVQPIAGGSVLTMTPRRTGTDGFFVAILQRR
ncbi:RsmB/NOP family class I SAM-dependent RNA methyltransferase [Aurantimonas sp. MSK8Z-1]|uniref:RsmB/NOP family class I SAM-dependent RNA methyltransferase n=1 Tax=Mangrovibrevibacter kandeliae TaxID=2968473 RepID=UPI0021183F19|nr:RsmB/NOP family class I SAM-dependent RNA methyltransferase [Aurantimonas sp. MSK8Z-1]MCW4115928.1 RsmB/NOP family class I SAM-dependent RNA methyltransferase [Aurantimonas sp. MSK8Z-1]